MIIHGQIDIINMYIYEKNLKNTRQYNLFKKGNIEIYNNKN